MVIILMMSARMATPGNKAYDVIIPDCDVTSNSIVL